MPSLIASGTINVPTLPSTSVNPPPSDPIGLIGVDPTYGTQTVISTNPTGGAAFVNPQEVVEAPSRNGFIAVPPQLYVADGRAGTNRLGAIIEYDQYRGTTTIVADSGSGGLINDPIALAFQGTYLYVANSGDQSLARLDPNNGWRQSDVTVNGSTHGVFTVVTDLKRVPGSSNALYLLDEGGFIAQSGQGPVWKLTSTDSLHASESAFPISPTDFRHPAAMTPDLSNPSSVDPIVGAGGLNGVNPTLLVVNPTGFTILAQNVNYLTGGNGLIMGPGSYGTNTIFVSNTANGPNPGYTPAQISAIDRLNATQEQALPNSVGGNLSYPAGAAIYHSSGGSAAPSAGNHSPVLVPSDDQAGFVQQMQVSAMTSSTMPSTLPAAVLTQAIGFGAVGEPTLTDKVTQQNTALDSLFADSSSGHTLQTFSGALFDQWNP